MKLERNDVEKLISVIKVAKRDEEYTAYEHGIDTLVDLFENHNITEIPKVIDDKEIFDDFRDKLEEDYNSANLTPDTWKREGWLALCDEHLEDYKDDERDVYEDIMVPRYCDHKDCNNIAVHELYPDLASILEKVKKMKSTEWEELK